MRQNWILITGLILMIVLTGCVSSPAGPSGSAAGPGSVPAAQSVPSRQGTPVTVAKTGSSVSVYYTGTLDNGTVFDTNVNAAPLTFTLGKGMVVPGFEEAVLGMGMNESKTVVISFARAYGSYDPSRVHTVNRSARNDMIPVVGQQVTVRRSPDGALIPARIINVTATTFTYDENNPLAGENLTFSIRVIGIK